MALFKPLLGKRENLHINLTNGYAYFCTDDGSFWIDYMDSDGIVKRRQINAQEAEKLVGYDLVTTVTNDATAIPVSSAVFSALEGYSQKNHNHEDIDAAIADLVQSRTHWKEDHGFQELFNGTVEVSNGWGPGQGKPITIEIKPGASYYVTYNGTTYNVFGKVDSDGISYIGSDTLWYGNDYITTEEPFCYGYGYFGASTDGTHTVVILGVFTEWHTLEKEYLPGILIRCGTGFESNIFNSLYNTASGSMSHAEGHMTSANGNTSHAEGYGTLAKNTSAHAEGYRTEANGFGAHAEGDSCSAMDASAHAEGYNTVATGKRAHAEGYETLAFGYQSHSEGSNTEALQTASHAEGKGTVADSKYQHVQGTYNISDDSSTYAHIVGNGTADDARSNAHTLDWNGNAWFKGKVYVGGSSQSGGTALASTLAVTTAEYETMSTNNELQESTLYMLTDDTSEEDLQATVDGMNNIDYDTYLAFDTTEIV